MLSAKITPDVLWVIMGGGGGCLGGLGSEIGGVTVFPGGSGGRGVV